MHPEHTDDGAVVQDTAVDDAAANSAGLAEEGAGTDLPAIETHDVAPGAVFFFMNFPV